MTTNKGGRPPSPDGPMDDSYNFRGPKTVLGRFKRTAARAAPTVLLGLISWWLGDTDDLPARPHERKAA